MLTHCLTAKQILEHIGKINKETISTNEKTKKKKKKKTNKRGKPFENRSILKVSNVIKLPILILAAYMYWLNAMHFTWHSQDKRISEWNKFYKGCP